MILLVHQDCDRSVAGEHNKNHIFCAPKIIGFDGFILSKKKIFISKQSLCSYARKKNARIMIKIIAVIFWWFSFMLVFVHPSLVIYLRRFFCLFILIDARNIFCGVHNHRFRTNKIVWWFARFMMNVTKIFEANMKELIIACLEHFLTRHHIMLETPHFFDLQIFH